MSFPIHFSSQRDTHFLDLKSVFTNVPYFLTSLLQMHIFWLYIWIFRTIDEAMSEPQLVLLPESGQALALSLNDHSRGAQVVRVHYHHVHH